MEAVYGRDISEMLTTLSYQGLVGEVDAIMDVNPNDTHLRLHLKDRDPDDGMTAIAYDKGYFFLRLLEETVGRKTFDEFLKTYFTTHAFQVMDTDTFLGYLNEHLLVDDAAPGCECVGWVDGPGLPENCPEVSSKRIERTDAALAAWVDGTLTTEALPGTTGSIKSGTGSCPTCRTTRRLNGWPSLMPPGPSMPQATMKCCLHGS